MDRQGIFILVVTISVANGILSPFIAVVFALAPLWMPEILPRSPAILAYVSSIILASATLLASGVPAAIYERLFGTHAEDKWPMYVWLASAFFLSIPAFERLGS